MEKFIIGVVTKPKGLKGEVKVNVNGADVENLLKVKKCYVAGLPYTIEKSYLGGNGFFVKLNGIDSVEQAENLRGEQFEIDRADASPLSDGEFYVADLIGKFVYFENGEKLGKLNNVVNYGASDILVIRTQQKEYMVPDVNGLIIDFDGENLIISKSKFEEVSVCD